MTGFCDQLRQRAASIRASVVFPEGHDPRVVAAAEHLEREGLCVVEVLSHDLKDDSRLDEIADLLRRRKPERLQDDEEARVHAAKPLMFAAGLVALGQADAAVAGATGPTADVVRAALWAVGTAPGVSVVSGAFYMVVGQNDDERVFSFADAGVVPAPTADQLAAIALATALDRRRIVGDEPTVAFLSFSTAGSAVGPSVQRVRNAVELFHELAPDISADGELQADAALVENIRARKAPDSRLLGSANVLIFPDLDSGNIAYKLVQHLAGATAIGPILQGLARPIADLSRGASVSDIINIALVAVLQSREVGHA